MIQINSIYHDIQLSFGTSDVKRTTIKQNSEDTHILRIKLYDKQNNEITIDSNWNINISALKGDKTHILNTNNISVENNMIQVTMTKQMLTAAGTEKCELVIRDGEQVLFSDTFLIYVEPNVQDGSFIESSDEYDSIVDTLRHVEEKKDKVDQLTNEIEETKVDIDKTYDELKTAVEETNDLIQENEIIKSNEAERKHNEEIRQSQEAGRQTNTATAISNAEEATVNANNAAERANSATDDLQDKLASHHFVLAEDKDVAGGVPSLDDNAKVPIVELYDATTSNKGVTQLTDSISSTSTTTAATPNSVKIVNDELISEKNRALSIENTLETNKADKSSVYTKNEVDNKFSSLETNIDWKESVATYDDIATTYPNPVDGWTVNVKDTDYTYRYNGAEWVTISANAIPKATSEVDGLLSKEDYTNYEDANSKKHIHDNKSVIDKITQNSLDNLDSAYNHSTSAHAPSNAEENQNAFSKVAIGDTMVSADSPTDTLTLEGSNITITPDATNDKVMIGITKENVVSALGYTPGSSEDTNTTYSLSKSGSTITLTGSDGSTTSVDDSATKAEQDGNGNVIAETYLPLSGGTLTGSLDIRGAAASQPLKTRGIVGSDGEGDVGELYLQYEASKAIFLGNTGAYNISADGSSYSGNSSTATKLKTARTIALTGSVTGSGTFDGSGNLSIATTTNHTHSYLPLSGGTMTDAIKRNGNAVVNTGTDGSTNFSGGTTLSDGATLVLRGSTQSGIEGRFELGARDASTSAGLTGKPDGTLQWSGSLLYLSNSTPKISLNGMYFYRDGGSNHSTHIYGNTSSYPHLWLRQFSNVFQFFPNTTYASGTKEVHIGHSAYRFGDAYLTNVYNSSGVITTSDRNKKHDIEEITDEFSKEIVDGLIPSSFKFNDGSSGRTHFGIIAQDLEKLLEALGISTTDFAPLVKEYPDKEVEIENPDYDENDKSSEKYIKRLEKDYDGVPTYNVRYEEFIMILVKYCQGLKKKDLELEQRISELESKLNDLLTN